MAGVTVPGGERVWGDGFREKLIDCRREGFALSVTILGVPVLLPLPLALPLTLPLPLPLRPWGLKARATSGPTVRIVLVYGFG